MILNEANYFKNKELDIIDKNMAVIKDRLIKNNMYDPTNSKENKEIEKCLCNVFNFEKAEINWEQSLQVNGYTFPFGNSLIPLNKSDFTMEKTSNGFRFKKSKGKVMFISVFTSIFTVADLSPREATALLLHEVGHNFYVTERGRILYPILLIYEMILQIIKMTSDPKVITQFIKYLFTVITMCTKNGRKIKIDFDKFDRDNGGIIHRFSNIFKFIDSIISEILDIILTIFLSPLILVSGVSKVLTLPLDIIEGFIVNGYRNEKFADNFATMYGYGVETASLQSKIDKIYNTSAGSKVISKIPIVNIYYETISYTVMAMMQLGDVHPTSVTRIKDQKRFLEDALNNKNLSPKLKKEIIKQIDDINKIYKDLYIESDEKNIKTAFYNLKNSLSMSDDDWKENIWGTTDYNYDNVFGTYTK